MKISDDNSRPTSKVDSIRPDSKREERAEKPSLTKKASLPISEKNKSAGPASKPPVA